MEQQQIKVRLSIGKKLVISLVVLVLIAITLLNGSAIYLLREDKRAYLFQNQASHVALVGREISNTIRHGLDTLRIALGSFDPTQPPSAQNKSILQTVVDNQSDVGAIYTFLMNPSSGQLSALVDAERGEFNKLGYSKNDLDIPITTLQQLLPELLKNSFAVIGFSQPNRPPMLGVLFADLANKSNPGGMPVAVGAMDLSNFAKALSDLNLSVSNTTGWSLFDTDQTRMLSHQSLSEDPLFRAAAQSKFESGAMEYEDSSGHFLGSFIKPGYDMIVMAREDWKLAMRATYDLTEKYIILGLLVLGVAIVFAMFFAKTISSPIKALFRATQEVAAGNFEVRLQRKTNDEVGALTDSFVVMSQKIIELIKESMEKVQLENELAIASTVQQTLFPDPNYEDDNVEICGLYQSASQCGGDWWGFFRHENKLCIMIADATGHGLPSALMTASARSCFSVLEAMVKENINLAFQPKHFLRYANHVICEASRGQVMMTFFVGILDFQNKKLQYANAGHNPPWLFRRTEDAFELKSLTARGVRLGEEITATVDQFEEKTVEIGESDILFMYTDGLLEGKDSQGAQYGKKRMREVIEGSLDAGPDGIIHNLMEDFMVHNGSKALDDDVTLAVTRIRNLGTLNG